MVGIRKASVVDNCQSYKMNRISKRRLRDKLEWFVNCVESNIEKVGFFS